MMTQPGAYLMPTIDCFTRPGSVQLVDESGAQVEADYQRVKELETGGLFVISE